MIFIAEVIATMLLVTTLYVFLIAVPSCCCHGGHGSLSTI